MTRKTKTRKPLTLAVVRKRLHERMRVVHGDLYNHRYRWCDNPKKCTGCSQYEAQLAAYRTAIKLAGGRVNE